VIWSIGFWRGAAERAVKTAAQTAVAFFVVGETGVADVDWATVGGISLVAAIVSVLTSLASAPFGPENTPSLVWDGDIVDEDEA
jgi:hypothetical protein